MVPIAGSMVRRTLEPSTSFPGPSNAPGTSKQTPLVVIADSDDSAGPSVSQRGSPSSTSRKRRGKENRQPHRRVQHREIPSSNRDLVAVDDTDAPRRNNKKNFWTPEETDLVRRGFRRYGTVCRKIRERYFPEDSPRSIENIRDKIKTMKKRGELPE